MITDYFARYMMQTLCPCCMFPRQSCVRRVYRCIVVPSMLIPKIPNTMTSTCRQRTRALPPPLPSSSLAQTFLRPHHYTTTSSITHHPSPISPLPTYLRPFLPPPLPPHRLHNPTRLHQLPNITLQKPIPALQPLTLRPHRLNPINHIQQPRL